MPWKVLHFLLSKCDFSRSSHTERSWHTYRFTVVFVSGRQDLTPFSRASLVVLFCGENGTAVLSTELWLWALIPAWWIERQSSQTEESIQKSEVGNQKWKIGSRKSEVGSRKWEIRSRKSEVGSQKSEVGSGRSEGLAIQLWVRTLSSLKSEVWSMKS